MGFTVGSTRCLGHRERSTISQSDVGLLVVDGSVAVLAVTISGVAFAIIPGSWLSGYVLILPLCGIGGSAGLILLDGSVLLARVIATKKSPKAEENLKEVSSSSDSSLDEVSLNSPKSDRKKEIKASILKCVKKGTRSVDSGAQYHKILGNLYLGACFPIFNWYNEGKEKSAPFDTIITCHPLTELITFNRHEEFNQTPEKIREKFKEKEIDWKFVGHECVDNPFQALENWTTLMYNCTFEEVIELDLTGCVDPSDFKKRVKKHHQKKLRLLGQLNIRERFEPTFKIIDAGVFGETNTYVHCFAGRSRSVTLLAAYLINRFDLSSEEALGFLAIRRPIQCNFVKQLKQYEIDLRASQDKR